MDKRLSVTVQLYLVLTIVVLGFHYVNGQGGIPSPPINLMGTPTTTTSITLSWEHLEGSVDVDSYEIIYTYIINECSSNMMRDPQVTVTLSNSSQRSYTINNAPNSPVEEDSEYSISLIAINSVGRSAAAMVRVITPEAAPGIPEELQTVSASITNITIRWDRVNCRDRNGHTDSYRVVSYPTLSFDPNDRVAQTVVGTGDHERMFSITGLPPRTSYTFEVQASNPNIDVSGPPASITANTTAPQGLGFLLKGRFYRNNSIVTVTDIGTSIGLGVYCLTPSLECCRDSETPNAASVTREWYLPDATSLTSDNSPFIKSRVSSAVTLHRDRFTFNTAPIGMYCCEIPVSSEMIQDIVYIGVYPQGDGSPAITSLLFDRNSTTLTCTSTGGPPTTVTWRKDGQPINQTLYEQSQRLVDAERATYVNVLFNANIPNFVGSFTCEVSNVRGMTQETTVLNGVSIDRDQLNIGTSATASCYSNAPATRMEWLQNGIAVLSDMSTQQLDLVFSPVSDSIHNQVYVCRVTRQGGAQAEQNFTAIVDVPPNALTATVSSSGTATAGMVYSLTCTVSKTVGGLINSPTASWTTGGVVVTNGNGIAVSNTTGDMVTTSTLTFAPLRTSHEGSFVCSGTLTSPALDITLMPSTTEDLEIQISTPDVIITVPPGPFYAGRIAPLSLTCTISINSATDTDVAISDMDITWLRGITRLSSGDARVTISSVAGSRPSFTSTLTLDPLSTADNSTTFTCRARARPPPNVPSFVVASEMGEGIMPIVVNLPSPPTVSIDPFNRFETAGQPLTLTCSASIQEGVTGIPVLTWSREDASLSSDIALAPPLLSFPSLRTSHAGRYTCTARLSIPEAGVDVSGDRTTNISIQFMPPPPVISGSPRNTSFFQGLNIILTCSITLGSVVDTPVTVRGIWNRNGIELMDGDESGKITIVNPSMSSPPYDITLGFNPLNVTDAGTYECHVTITPQDTTFISTAATSNSRAISVSAFPTQFVDIIAEGISTAGFSGYTLICSTSRKPDLPPTSTLAVQWLDPRGNVISSGGNFTISGVGPTTDVRLISRLVFNSLYTSQAGEYSCKTLQTIPATVTNHSESVIFSVQVELPAPISPLAFRHNRNTALNAGTSFSLTCIITPNTTGVDTDFAVESSITGNGIHDTDRVSVSPRTVTVGENTYETTVMFTHLLEADTGAYNCSAYVTSPPSLPNVITSDLISGLESISVGPLQTPTLSVLPIQGISVEAGGQDTITCIALFDEYLVERPTLVWEFSGSIVDITMGDQLRIRATTTRTLIFNRIRTSQAGVYTCRATINIQGIDCLTWIANQTVQVQIPRPVTANQTVPVQTAPEPASTASDNTAAVIGGVVAVVIVLIIAVTTGIIVIIALILRSRKAEFSPNQEPLPSKVPGNDILYPTDEERGIYATIISTGHEYEILDKNRGNQAYEDISPLTKPKPEAGEAMQLQPLPSGNYDFTQCPAYYISVATTSIHDSNNKPPSTQPTAA